MTLQTAGALADRGERPLLEHCAIDRTMRAIGSRTALILVREVFYGASRFDALVRRTGMTEATAAARLRELVEAGVLDKVPYREEGQRTRHEYVLTDAGHDLLPAMIALLEWGQSHTERSDGRRTRALSVTHAGCGADVRVEVRCAAGHDVAEDDVVLTSS